MSHYVVHFWVNPRSGFDLARKSQVMTVLRELVEESFQDEAALELLSSFEKEYDGLVMETLTVDIPEDVPNHKKLITAEIKKKYPEAVGIAFLKSPQYTR